MRVLIACEESQRVCEEFRKRGHEAYSCDIQEPSGGYPEWHILGDVVPLLKRDELGAIRFQTMDNKLHGFLGTWDLIIAHPPCTFLSNVATRHHSLKTASLEKINERTVRRIEAMKFFMLFAEADCDHVAIENPVGVMNTCYRKPDQIIHPYMFAESVNDKENYHTKATCLWLKGLPPLKANSLPSPNNEALYGRNPSGKVSNWEERQTGGKERANNRSKTFPGIARAMGIVCGDNLCAAAKCRAEIHNGVNCPYIGGRLVCMSHCLKCRYHITDGLAGQWCRFFPKGGGQNSKAD